MAALQNSVVASHLRASTPSPLTVTSSAATTRSLSLPRSSFTPSSIRLRLRRTKSLLPSRRRRGRFPVPVALNPAADNYAAALLDLAREKCCIETTSSDMEEVAKLLSDPSTLAFFTNPLIDASKKHEIIDAFATDACLQPHTTNFLHVVLQNKRMDLIPEIANSFDVAYNRESGTEIALVTSVVPLDSTHLTQIAQFVQSFTGAKNVRVRTSLDPDLIAGFTLRYGKEMSNVIDMSVRKQLEDMARQVSSDVELVDA